MISAKHGTKNMAHDQMLFEYLEKMHKLGAKDISADGVKAPWITNRASLIRGNRRLDAVFKMHGRTYECELKLSSQLGKDKTKEQLMDYSKTCKNLVLIVSAADHEQAERMIEYAGLVGKVIIHHYDEVFA